MTADEARRRFAESQVARLASVGSDGAPHVVPITFAVLDDSVYSAIDDAKPKRTRSLRRVANIAANPSVAVLADHYSDDWSTLWWVRGDGRARLLGAGSEEGRRALDALARRYAPYRERTPPGPIIAIDVGRWVGWSATGGA